MELNISDLDGTLLNGKAEVSDKTCRLINEAIDRGVNFTAATARTLASVGKILQGIKLRLPVILMNGVLIYDFCEKKYIFSAYLEGTAIRRIVEILGGFGADPFVYTIENDEMHTYYERLSSEAMQSFYGERRRKYYKSFTQVDSFSEIREDTVIYFTLIDSYEKLKPVYDAVSSLGGVEITFYRDNYSDELWYMEIFSENASKKKAVEFLRKRLKADKIICFGDNLNDIPMFEAADYSIAVGNAADEVKLKADEIIGRNTDDSVACYISQKISEEKSL